MMMPSITAFTDALKRAGLTWQEGERIRLREIGAYAPRPISGSVVIEHTGQVQELIRIANQWQVPLFPFSRGKNWGLGSKLPTEKALVLVDLGALNRVRHLDKRQGFAIVEAGVSQGQLAGMLAGSPFMLNLTSAGSPTSIIGNALERGIGYHRPRTADIGGLEVFLGAGQRIRCGSFWREEQLFPFYKPGLGPGLPNMFLQSNLGIVTAGIIRLIPVPEQILLVALPIVSGKLLPVLAKLQRLYQQGIISGVSKIFDRPDNEYQLFTCIGGTDRVVTFFQEEIRRALKGSGDLYFHGDELLKPGADPVLQSQFQLFSGIPSDLPLGRYLFKPDTNSELDQYSYLGMRLITPLVPFRSQYIRKAIDIIRSFEEETEVEINYTFNLLSSSLIDLVIYLHFVRNENGALIAKRIHEGLLSQFVEAGLFPYRLDIDHQDLPNEIYDSGYMDFLRKLKAAADPNGIIAPGRYGI